MVWTANRVLTLVLGILFTWVGFFGFFVSLSMTAGILFVFDVDLIHNLIHLVTGLLALFATFTETTFAEWSRLFNRIFGVIYLILGIAGLFPALYLDGRLLCITHVNAADNVLHIVVGLVACIVGYALAEYPATTRTAI
jgi:hypothetical protein